MKLHRLFLAVCCIGGILIIGATVFADNIDDAIARLKKGDEDVREDAVEYLGNVGDQRAVEALMEAMIDPKDDIREKAAKGLGKIGGPDAVPVLIKALKDDSFGVRGEAIKALGRIGDQRAIDPLQRIAADAINPWTSQAASKAIMNIKNRIK